MKKTNHLRLLLVLTMMIALLLGCLSGCAKTEPQPDAAPAASSAAPAVSSAPAAEPEESDSASAAAPEPSISTSAKETMAKEAQQLDRHELDEKSAAILDGDDHEFEREIAYRYYHGSESRTELTDTERNQWMSGIDWGSVWGFDDKGHGVFAVGLDASMQQSQWFIEYTSDYGETWSGAGMYSLVGWITDVRVAGNRVVFSVTSNMYDSKYSLMYSDDLCQSFYLRDTIDFAPASLTAVLQDEKDEPKMGMNILNIGDDGSVVLGWYLKNHINISGFEYFNDNVCNYFLIGKTNAELTRCEVLYAAGNQ